MSLLQYFKTQGLVKRGVMSTTLGAVAHPLIPAIPSNHKTTTERFTLVLFASCIFLESANKVVQCCAKAVVQEWGWKAEPGWVGAERGEQ